VDDLEIARQLADLEHLLHDRRGPELHAQGAATCLCSAVRAYDAVEDRRVDVVRLADIHDHQIVSVDQLCEQLIGLLSGREIVLTEQLEDNCSPQKPDGPGVRARYPNPSRSLCNLVSL